MACTVEPIRKSMFGYLSISLTLRIHKIETANAPFTLLKVTNVQDHFRPPAECVTHPGIS